LCEMTGVSAPRMRCRVDPKWPMRIPLDCSMTRLGGEALF
jgi:hypothetical protein